MQNINEKIIPLITSNGYCLVNVLTVFMLTIMVSHPPTPFKGGMHNEPTNQIKIRHLILIFDFKTISHAIPL